MGFMTEISFLNDNWHVIKERILDDPQKFVDEITVLMNGRPVYGAGDEKGRRKYLGREFPGTGRLGLNASFKMYPSHHADTPRLYLAFQNMFLSLNRYDLEEEYGKRLDNPGDHLLEVLDRFLGMAEGTLHSTSVFLREKIEERESG